jgi:hypothetical protein
LQEPLLHSAGMIFLEHSRFTTLYRGDHVVGKEKCAGLFKKYGVDPDVVVRVAHPKPGAAVMALGRVEPILPKAFDGA